MFSIALQGLRGRKGPFAGAFIALAVAAALVMACGSLLQAGLESKSPVERYSGAAVVVAGDQNERINVGTDNEDSVPLYERVRVPARLASELAALPGVRSAVADVAVPADLVGAHGAIPGPGGHETAIHPWDTAPLTPYRLAAGRAPLGPHEVVVDRGVAARGGLSLGDTAVLASNAPGVRVAVVGIARTSVRVERQGVLFADRATVERLAAVPARADAIGILPAAGADTGRLAARVRRALRGRAQVNTGAARGDVEHLENIEARDAVTAIGGTFGGLALFIAMFVVASTIGLSVLQREREVALLRAVAATPKQGRRMIRWGTLVGGLFASVAGVVPGALFAQILGYALSDRGIAPEDMEVTIGAVPVVAAIGSSVLTALIAVAAAGRRAARVRPTVALQESAGSHRLIGPLRVLAGVVMATVGFGMLGIAAAGSDPSSAADMATGASLAFVLASALLGPLVVRVVAGLASVVLARRSGSVSAFLAVSNMRTAAGRFASATTPLVLTIALSATLLFSGTTREHAATTQERERVVADLVVQSDGAGLPRDALAAIRKTSGVRGAVAVAPTMLGPGLGSKYTALQGAAIDGRNVGDVLDLDVKTGSLAGLHGHAVALSAAQAAKAHTVVGHSVRVTLGDGTHLRVRVAAIYKRGLGFGDVVLPSALTRHHTTTPLLGTILVRADARADVADVAGHLRRIARTYPGMTVGDRDDHAARADRDRETDNWLFRILAAIIFVFTAIAVVNTLVMIALHRTRELALLRLIGGTRRQVIAMSRWEGGMTVLLGLGLGAVIALVTLVPTAAVLGSSPSAPLPLVALVFGSAAAVGLIATQVATRIALRPRPVDGIGVHD